MTGQQMWTLKPVTAFIVSALCSLPIFACDQERPTLDPETEKGFALVPENGIVISSPGMDPVVIQPGSREMIALGGTLKFLHVFRDGQPVPAESRSVIVASAGPMFLPESDGVRLGWAVMLDPKKEDDTLRGITRVTVEDVTGAQPVMLMQGPPEIQRDSASLFARSAGTPFTKTRFPWMFSDEDSILILRITLTGETAETLLQPVFIGQVAKRQIIERFGGAG